MRGEEVREEEVRGEEVRGEEVREEDVREEDVREEDVLDRLDESEEERVADDDDGFGTDNVQRRNFQQVLERWNKLKAKSSSVRKKRNVGEGSFVTNDCVGQHEINEEYDSEQVCSDVDTDEGVSDKVPKFVKYNAEDMNKSFKFRLGMEFCSLKDFKHALMEHSVLNGKEIKFVKNDDRRVRAVCKKKCGFLIMVSKVVRSHRCGRVMFNKNANKDWIA